MQISAEQRLESHRQTPGPALGDDDEVTLAGRALRALVRPLPMLVLVVVVAMLSFYVHLIEEQVLRGERLREAQRSDAANPVAPIVAPRQSTTARQSAPSRSARGH